MLLWALCRKAKLKKALDALKGLSAPHARAIRNGVETILNASELVPGDIIRLEAGDFYPCRCPAAAQRQPKKAKNPR